MIKRRVLIAILIVSGMSLTSVAAVEEAKYRVLEKREKYEIREYAPRLVAETTVTQEFEEAGNVAFERLFAFISGENGMNEKIDMTAPVSQRAADDSIMPESFNRQNASFKDWVISFTMPSKYTLENLPEPENKTISFRKETRHKVAALRFSGHLNSELASRKVKELETWMNKNNYPAKSSFVFAQYNPPFIPGIFRRNEVLVNV